VLTWKCLPLLVPVLLSGCAHGFDRNALRERLNDGTLQSTDADIAAARALKPQLRLPCRMAVYLQPSRERDWHWTPEDRAAMEQWVATLKQEGIVADVIPLPEMLVKDGNLKELRLAAARCGADVLFVVHGAAQTDSYKNFAAVFDVTVVGGFVVPGSHKDTLFLMEGLLLDVENGYIYTGVQAEGVGKIIRPSFMIEERDAIVRAKTKTVAQFGANMLQRMRTLASWPPDLARVERIINEGKSPVAISNPLSGSNLNGRPGEPSNPSYAVPAALPTPTLPGVARDPRLSPLNPGGVQNAAGVMTGITAPRLNP